MYRKETFLSFYITGILYLIHNILHKVLNVWSIATIWSNNNNIIYYVYHMYGVIDFLVLVADVFFLFLIIYMSRLIIIIRHRLLCYVLL